ncbi:HAD family phosphatase [Candidatus Gottesmanbacteria bacterium]|nr:HAD family phosphatase [Candidatus Gottesmanbacteria bacterium]
MNTHRLFVFDMDGVLVASEKVWMETEPTFLHDLFGKEIARGIGDTIGMSIGEIYNKAVTLGATLDKKEFDRLSNEAAIRVYGRCSISEGTDELVDYLLSNHWQLALLSSSPMLWIDQVLVRLPWREKLAAVLSLNEHHELRPKPAPDGYRFLLQQLNASPEVSVALEDSNPGIASARAAGFFTIGYREHLPDGYIQAAAAAATAQTMQDVLAILARGTIFS